jgi:hypothetical protein
MDGLSAARSASLIVGRGPLPDVHPRLGVCRALGPALAFLHRMHEAADGNSANAPSTISTSGSAADRHHRRHRQGRHPRPDRLTPFPPRGGVPAPGKSRTGKPAASNRPIKWEQPMMSETMSDRISDSQMTGLVNDRTDKGCPASPAHRAETASATPSGPSAPRSPPCAPRSMRPRPGWTPACTADTGPIQRAATDLDRAAARHGPQSTRPNGRSGGAATMNPMPYQRRPCRPRTQRRPVVCPG